MATRKKHSSRPLAASGELPAAAPVGAEGAAQLGPRLVAGGNHAALPAADQMGCVKAEERRITEGAHDLSVHRGPVRLAAVFDDGEAVALRDREDR